MAIWCPQDDCKVTISSVTQSSAKFTLVFYATATSNLTRYVKLWVDGDLYKTIKKTTTSTTVTFSTTISGLSAGTPYDWTAMLGYYDSGGTAHDLSAHEVSGSFTTLSAVLNVDPWSWTSSNGEATTTMTKNAYNVVQGTMSADNFSHYVWNDLVDKVMEVRAAKGYTWDSNGGTTQSGAKVVSGETLSAKKFNSLKYNIGTMRGTFADVSPGDEILGSYFTRLTDVLNDIIANP